MNYYNTFPIVSEVAFQGLGYCASSTLAWLREYNVDAGTRSPRSPARCLLAWKAPRGIQQLDLPRM